MRKRLFLCGMLCVIAGILLRVTDAGLWVMPLAVLPLLFASPRKKSVGAALFLAVCLVCGFWRSDALYRVETEELPDCTLTGTIEYVSDTGVLIENAQIASVGRAVSSPHVTIYTNNTGNLVPGQTVFAEGRCVPYAFRAENPGERDGRLTAMAAEEYYVMYADAFTVTGYVKGTATFRYGFRTGVHDILDRHVTNEDVKEVLYAMVTGDRSELDPYVADSFSATGISHLLAVSGLHVNIMLIAVLYLLRLLRIKHIFRVLPLAALLGVYSVLTDFLPPILRASLMVLFAALAEGTGQRYDPLNGLGAAGIVLLSYKPYSLFEASFLMSFAACLGILCFARKARHGGLLGTVEESASVTAGATFSTLPLGLYYFGAISLISLPVNLIAVPPATVAMFLLVIGLVCCLVWQGFGILLKMAEWLMVCVLGVAEKLSRIPMLTVGFVHYMVIPVGVALAGVLSKFFGGGRLLRFICAGVLVVCLVFCFWNSDAVKDDYLRLLSFSYGGNCVHIRCGTHYFVGMNRMYPGRVTSYAGHCTNRVKGTFLLCTDDVLGFLEVYDMGFRSDVLYVAEKVPVTVRATLALFGEVVTLFEGDTVKMPRGVFIYRSGGLILQWGLERIWLQQNGDTTVPDGIFSLAVTDCEVKAVYQFGTKVRESLYVRYATKQYGCMTAYFTGNGITVEPFKKETT